MACPYKCAALTAAALFIFLLCTTFMSDITWVSITGPIAEFNRRTNNGGGAYEIGDLVDVCFSKIWPYNNPTETYDYFSHVDICKPDVLEPAPMSIGQIIRGDRLVRSKYDIQFGKDIDNQILCKMNVSENHMDSWRGMIDAGYMIEVYVDDLPVQSYFGIRVYEKADNHTNGGAEDDVQSTQYTDNSNSKFDENIDDEPRMYKSVLYDELEQFESSYQKNQSFRLTYNLITHLEFVLGHNDGVVVSAQILPNNARDGTVAYTDISDIVLYGTREVTFSYSVRWEHRPDIPTHLRLYSQLRSSILRSADNSKSIRDSNEIHWLSLANSFIVVVLILVLLAYILLRILRADMTAMLLLPDEELSGGAFEEGSGWKLLHADVFRPPPHRMALAAMVGCGLHLLLVSIAIISVATVSPYLPHGTLFATGVIAYLFTTFIAGFVSTNLYTKMGGQKWAWNIIFACCMFLVPAFLVWTVLTLIAIAYGSTAALPVSKAFALLFCGLFVTLPLTIIGGIMGRRRALRQMVEGVAYPCKTNKLAREIPRVRCHQSPWLHMLLSGFLPFSGIYVELHYLFISVWSSSKTYAYSFLLLAVLLFLTSSSAVCLLLTYMHLNSENHLWQWRAFLSGGSVAIYFCLHSIYYFFSSTAMNGMLQVSHFFGYSIILAWMMCLIAGCSSFFATSQFVKYIYSRIKVD